MAQAPLIDRKFMERLERLTIHWRKSFPGLVGGHNSSRLSGAGQEFLDHRNFHSGDDLRSVNWRAYLRLEKLFLKMFALEPRVPIRMLLDVSASMTASEPMKFDFARKLAAALCYVGLVRLDTITVQPFRDQLLESHTCGGGRHRFLPVVDFLQRQEAHGPTDYLKSMREFLDTYPQRGLVIVLSDFLDAKDCEKPLQYLSDFGHELLLIQVWNESDRYPPWNGELDLEDAETGEHLQISFNEEARERYVAAFDQHSDRLRKLAQRAGGRYVGFSSEESLDDAIQGALAMAQGVA